MSGTTLSTREATFQRLRDLAAARIGSTPNWVEHASQTGETYYYNAITQASVWDKPSELQTPGEIVLSEFNWKEYKDAEGRTYFHDTVSAETCWDPPQTLIDVKKWIEEFSAATGEGAAAATDTAQTSRAVSEEQDDEGDSETSSETSAVRSQSPSSRKSEPLKDKTPAPEEKAFDVFSVGDINSVEKKEAAEAFRKFLDEKNVPSNVNWENCVKIIQSDKRFDVWKKFTDRKQAFNQYKILKQKQEKEDQRKRQEKARELFEKMLLNTDKVSYSTPYRDADRVFASDKTWRGVPERERESLYEDIMVVVEKREKEQAEKDREESMEKLGEILNNLRDVTHRTTWAECQRYLAECPAFMSDPVVKKISKLDALRVFMEHIIRLEKEREEEVRAERRQRKRLHRKYREAYQVLMGELCRQGIITSMAKWKSVFPIIRNDQRFISMQDQYGSNALDLFKLYVKDLQNRYTTDLELIIAILQDQKFTVTSSTEYSDCLRALHKDDRCLTIDRGNIKMAYDALRATAILEDKGREEEQKRQQEKEARQKCQLEEAFYQMLRDSTLVFGPNDKWLSVHDKFAGKPAYLAVRDEEDRIRLFHNYVAKVQREDVEEKEKEREREKERSGGGRKKSKKEKERREKEVGRNGERRKRQEESGEEEEPREKRRRERTPLDDDESQDSRSYKKRNHSPVDRSDDEASRNRGRKRTTAATTPPPEDDDQDSRSPRKKKRHHRSPETTRERGDRDRKRDDHGRHDSTKERSGKSRRPDQIVVAKAEKLAQDLSEDELENQRKLLMKQLGIDD